MLIQCIFKRTFKPKGWHVYINTSNKSDLVYCQNGAFFMRDQNICPIWHFMPMWGSIDAQMIAKALKLHELDELDDVTTELTALNWTYPFCSFELLWHRMIIHLPENVHCTWQTIIEEIFRHFQNNWHKEECDDDNRVVLVKYCRG